MWALLEFDAFIIFAQKIHNLIIFSASCWIIQHEINLHKLKQKYYGPFWWWGERKKESRIFYYVKNMSIFYEKFDHIEWLEFRISPDDHKYLTEKWSATELKMTDEKHKSHQLLHLIIFIWTDDLELDISINVQKQNKTKNWNINFFFHILWHIFLT